MTNKNNFKYHGSTGKYDPIGKRMGKHKTVVIMKTKNGYDYYFPKESKKSKRAKRFLD